MARYHHTDDVILAARALMALLEEDAPYGNLDESRKWAEAYLPTISGIAAQATEAEETGAAA